MDVPDEPEIPESSGGNEEAGHVEKTGQVSIPLPMTFCQLQHC